MTNRKICVNPFSAKVLSAFENEKIKVYAEEMILQVLFRGNAHINSESVTWKLQANIRFSSSEVQLEELFEPEVKLTLTVEFLNFAS